VLTRSKHHWSQLVSDDNPRGYSEKQKLRIADADTLVKKRRVELMVMNGRLYGEKNMKNAIDDEYGVDCINTMIADIIAEYAAMGVNAIVRDAGVIGTEGDEDAEEEDSDGDHERDSDHEPRPSKRYVYPQVGASMLQSLIFRSCTIYIQT
jgi:hypothetical protein